MDFWRAARSAQKLSFTPNCRSRGSRKVKTWPKVAEVTFVLSALKFVWLKTLNASARSWSRTVSPKRMFFASVKSNRVVGGPITTPLGDVPGTLAMPEVVVVGGLSWKHCVLNHWLTVCGALAFGSQGRFGLPRVGIELMKPSPAGS